MFFIFSLKVIPQGHLTAKGSLGFATLSITFFIEWPIMENCGGLKSYNLPYLCLGFDIELARLCMLELARLYNKLAGLGSLSHRATVLAQLGL